MSNPDHEALVEAIAAKIACETDGVDWNRVPDRPYDWVKCGQSTKIDYRDGARAVLALVLAKLETVTPEMADAIYHVAIGTDDWRAVLAASPLSPGRAEDKSGEAAE